VVVLACQLLASCPFVLAQDAGPFGVTSNAVLPGRISGSCTGSAAQPFQRSEAPGYGHGLRGGEHS
jgi:hypothetical protein